MIGFFNHFFQPNVALSVKSTRGIIVLVNKIFISSNINNKNVLGQTNDGFWFVLSLSIHAIISSPKSSATESLLKAKLASMETFSDFRSSRLPVIGEHGFKPPPLSTCVLWCLLYIKHNCAFLIL